MISIVQSTTTSHGNIPIDAPSENAGFENPPVAGNAILGMYTGFDFDNSLTMGTPVDTNGDIFTQLVTESGSFADIFSNTVFVKSVFFLATNIVGGANSQAVHIPCTHDSPSAVITTLYEIAGNPVLDAIAKGVGTSFPAGSGVALSPVAAQSIAFASVCPVVGIPPNNISMSSGGGWTLDTVATDNAAIPVSTSEDAMFNGLLHQILSSNTPIPCALSATITGSGSGWIATAITLAAQGALPGGTSNWLGLALRNSMRGLRK